MSVAGEIVTLAHERLLLWGQLREMAGVVVSQTVKDTITQSLEAEYDARIAAMTAEYEQRIAELKRTYPRVVARRMAESLMRGNGGRTISEIVAEAARLRVPPIGEDVLAVPLGTNGSAVTAAAGMPVHQAGAAPGSAMAVATAPADAAAAGTATAVAAAPAAAPATEAADDDDMAMEPYIDTDRCTTCNECTNLNGKMFAYDDNKQAYIRDARAGTFAQLVQAAERCPAALIHPGTPLNPNEKDLEKWIERAKPFN
jgi:pyruvate-ferredoxin/flavodoxin oxidoreductase